MIWGGFLKANFKYAIFITRRASPDGGAVMFIAVRQVHAGVMWRLGLGHGALRGRRERVDAPELAGKIFNLKGVGK